jgi:hypothetical protein
LPGKEAAPERALHIQTESSASQVSYSLPRDRVICNFHVRTISALGDSNKGARAAQSNGKERQIAQEPLVALLYK